MKLMCVIIKIVDSIILLLGMGEHHQDFNTMVQPRAKLMLVIFLHNFYSLEANKIVSMITHHHNLIVSKFYTKPLISTH